MQGILNCYHEIGSASIFFVSGEKINTFCTISVHLSYRLDVNEESSWSTFKEKVSFKNAGSCMLDCTLLTYNLHCP